MTTAVKFFFFPVAGDRAGADRGCRPNSPAFRRGRLHSWWHRPRRGFGLRRVLGKSLRARQKHKHRDRYFRLCCMIPSFIASEKPPSLTDGGSLILLCSPHYGSAKTTTELCPAHRRRHAVLGQQHRPRGHRLSLAGEDHQILLALHGIGDGARDHPGRRRCFPTAPCRRRHRARGSGGSDRPRRSDRRR